MKRIVGILMIGCFAGGLVPPSCDAYVSIRGDLTHERQLRPGETYKGTIRVNNTGDEPEDVKIYKTDYRFDCNGSYFYDPPGGHNRSNADWITFNPHRITVPPHGTSVINYVLEVPQSPDLVGTYWSIIMVEHVGSGKRQVSAEDETEVSVAVGHVIRYAIQIVTHIGSTGTCKLRFLNTDLVREGDERVLNVDLENVGERWLRPTLWTELYAKNGAYAGKFEAGRLRMYPGTSVRYTINLTEAEQGDYKALIVADCGDDVFGATYSLVIGR
jgi:hypothetical protein